jgi:hypothetical protein
MQFSDLGTSSRLIDISDPAELSVMSKTYESISPARGRFPSPTTYYFVLKLAYFPVYVVTSHP